MNLEVEIVSTEIIKPSTPTPNHLKQLTLSLVDQLAPCIYTPRVFFYNPPTSTYNDIDLATRLKDSLSQTLSLFYPFAGRITADECTIECTDDGIPFVESRPKCSLSDFLGASNKVDLVQHLVPMVYPISLGVNSTRSRHVDSNKPRGDIVKELVHLAFQLNIFECGGVAIGCYNLHKMLDATTMANFLKWWAALTTNRDHNDVALPKPDFEMAAKVFPPIRSEDVPKSLPRVPLTIWPSEEGGCIVKPFLFNAKTIAALRDKAKSEEAPNPTRVEVVSAFIWKHTMLAAQTSSPTSQGLSSILTHVVNIRPYTNLPLSPMTIGNMIMQSIAYHDSKDGEAVELKDLVINVRKAISKVKDPEFLSELIGEKGTDFVLKQRQQLVNLLYSRDLNKCKFTCWGKAFDMDFGFGKPIWTGMIGGKLESAFRNVHPMVETPNGIEAWLCLSEHEMTLLESDHEFMAVVTPTPY